MLTCWGEQDRPYACKNAVTHGAQRPSTACVSAGARRNLWMPLLGLFARQAPLIALARDLTLLPVHRLRQRPRHETQPCVMTTSTPRFLQSLTEGA